MAEVGPGGHHFGTPHTRARFTTEFFQSFLADRQGYENWVAAGSQDPAQRARVLWKDVLAAYEPPPIDPGLCEALDDYVARREREIGDKSLHD
jgi:trimethylamine---corrinoid protein Co-methyltransferase